MGIEQLDNFKVLTSNSRMWDTAQVINTAAALGVPLKQMGVNPRAVAWQINMQEANLQLSSGSGGWRTEASANNTKKLLYSIPRGQIKVNTGDTTRDNVIIDKALSLYGNPTRGTRDDAMSSIIVESFRNNTRWGTRIPGFSWSTKSHNLRSFLLATTAVFGGIYLLAALAPAVTAVSVTSSALPTTPAVLTAPAGTVVGSTASGAHLVTTYTGSVVAATPSYVSPTILMTPVVGVGSTATIATVVNPAKAVPITKTLTSAAKVAKIAKVVTPVLGTGIKVSSALESSKLKTPQDFNMPDASISAVSNISNKKPISVKLLIGGALSILGLFATLK